MVHPRSLLECLDHHRERRQIPVASQSKDEEEEEQEEEEEVVSPTDDEYDAEEQVESPDEFESSEEEEEEEEEVHEPKPKRKRVVAAAKKKDVPSFNPHGEDPFNPTYPHMMIIRKEGEESERQFKERSAAMGVAQATPGVVPLLLTTKTLIGCVLILSNLTRE
jgi:hypothetical protein